MTVKKFIEKYGWIFECNPNNNSKMVVDIKFLNNGIEDETEFDIVPYNVKELAALYNDFCTENKIPKNTVLGIVVVGMEDDIAC